jgi:hypothetical protein
LALCSLEFENRPLFSRYFSGLELIGVNGMHATVEVALREFIQENGGGHWGAATKAAPRRRASSLRDYGVAELY